jgi:hypothetical protein
LIPTDKRSTRSLTKIDLSFGTRGISIAAVTKAYMPFDFFFASLKKAEGTPYSRLLGITCVFVRPVFGLEAKEHRGPDTSELPVLIGLLFQRLVNRTKPISPKTTQSKAE